VDDVNRSDDPAANPNDELRELLGEDYDELDRFAVDGRGILHDLTSARLKRYPQPAPIVPIPVVDSPNVLGSRVICVNQRGPIYDLRAASDVFTDESGTWVRIVSERRWYAWLEESPESRGAACPRAVAWPAANVWVEHPQER
jgi:hypothetical protein